MQHLRTYVHTYICAFVLYIIVPVIFLCVYRIASLENQLNDAIKTIDKFNEQLAHTGAVWSNCVEERDKKYA